MSFKVPNLDFHWDRDPLLAESLQSLRDGIDTLGTKLSINPQGTTNAPAPPSAITVVAQNGVSHVSLTDNNPRTTNVHYFVEYDTNPNFTNAQTIHLGPTRQVRVPTFFGSNVYWRGYAQNPDGPPSSLVYHGSPQRPTPVNDGATGTGNAPSTLLLETNGIANGSQALLNLNAGSNMTLTDAGNGTVTLAAANGGASFTTAGQGFFPSWSGWPGTISGTGGSFTGGGSQS